MQDIIEGSIRRLWAGEANKYRDHLLRLDAASRHNRFSGVVSPDFIRRHAASASPLNSVVLGYFVHGELRGACELRMSETGREAEIAFSVERTWQSHGVGTALLERMLLAARNRGIKHLRLACLADNQRMQQLARKFEADLSFEYGSIVGELSAARPTPVSLMREWIAEGFGIADAALEAQSKMLKAG